MLSFVALALPVGACHGGPVKTGGPFYYASFKTKSLPEVPLHELSEQEASSKLTYYVVHYTPAGALKSFTKLLGGKVQWESSYVYSAEGRLLSGSTVSQESGHPRVRIEYVFDADGKIAKRSVIADEASKK